MGKYTKEFSTAAQYAGFILIAISILLIVDVLCNSIMEGDGLVFNTAWVSNTNN